MLLLLNFEGIRLTLVWYLEGVDQEALRWAKSYFTDDDWSDELKFYTKLSDKWQEIEEIDIPKKMQALIAYILYMYDERAKLHKLYKKYENIETSHFYIYSLVRTTDVYKINNIVDNTSDEELNNATEFSQIAYLFSLISVYSVLLDFNKAYEIIKITEEKIKALKERKCCPNTTELLEAVHYNSLATIYYRTRDNKNAKLYYLKSLELLENMKERGYYHPYELGKEYNSLGNAYTFDGLINKAREAYTKAKEHFSNVKIERGILVSVLNIATINIKLGKFEQALEKLKEAKSKMLLEREPRNTALLDKEIMTCLIELERYDEAIAYLNEILLIIKRFYVLQDDVYLAAIEFASILKQFSVAESLLDQFYKNIVVKKDDIDYYNAAFSIFSGILEFEKGNLYDSELLLSDGIKNSKKIGNAPLILTGLKYYTLLLFQKLELTHNNEYIEEIENILNEVIMLLYKYSNVFYRVAFQWMLARVYEYEGKFKLAKNILDVTLKLCEDYNIKGYITKIKKEQETIEFISRLPQNELRTKIVMRDITKAIKSFSYTQDISVSFDEFQNESLISILIIHPSGLPIYSYQFGEDENITAKELLISGLLKAIQSYSEGLIQEEGKFRMIEFENYIILLEKRENFFVALFTQDFSYLLKERLIMFTDKVEELLKETEILNMEYFTANTLTPINNKITQLLKDIIMNRKDILPILE